MAAPKPSMVWNVSDGFRRIVDGDMLSVVLKLIHDSVRSLARLAVVVKTLTSPDAGSDGVGGVFGSGESLLLPQELKTTPTASSDAHVTRIFFIVYVRDLERLITGILNHIRVSVEDILRNRQEIRILGVRHRYRQTI